MPTAVDRDEAMDLLLSLLTPEERAAFDASSRQALPVVGSEGGLFVIHMTGTQGNIQKLDEHGCQLGTVCVAPAARIPTAHGSLYQPVGYADSWLGQYLAIKHREPTLDQVGIWSRGYCQREPRPRGTPGLCPCGCGSRLEEIYAQPPVSFVQFLNA